MHWQGHRPIGPRATTYRWLWWVVLGALLLGLWPAAPAQAEGLPRLRWWLGETKHTRIFLKLQAFARPEWMTNRGDNRFASEDSDFYVASRVRVTGDILYRRSVGLRLTLQDSRFWGNGLKRRGKVRFTRAASEQFTREVFLGLQLFEGYIYLQWPDANVRFEAGRMRVFYGDAFFLGDPGFLPPGQSFDGLRLRWSPGGFRIDAMWLLVRESVATDQRASCTGWCFWEGDDLAGVYAHKTWGQHGTDLYAFYYQRAPRSDTFTEPSRIGVFGFRYAFDNPIVRVRLEAQLEVGRHRDRELLAGSGVARVRVTLPVPTKPFVAIQGLLATGDNDPTDNADHNFLPMFGNRRGYYGLVNLFGLSNLLQPMVRVGFRPHRQLSIAADVRYSWKFDPRGTLVGGGSHNPSIYDLTGADGRNLGTEIDLRIEYHPFPGVTFDLGAGVFLPAQGLHRRDISGAVLRTWGTDPSFMVFLSLWLEWG